MFMLCHQTCKTLREWSSMRFVWVKALRRTAEANSLFKPVLNYGTNSEPLTFLQHAATSPQRMLALLHRNQTKAEQDRKMNPFSKAVIPFLEPELSTELATLGRDEAQQPPFFVPGGRFIIVLSIYFSRLIVIDVDRYLDAKSNGVENPPLADYTVSAQYSCQRGFFQASMSNDCNTLFIVTIEPRLSHHEYEFPSHWSIGYRLTLMLFYVHSGCKFSLWKYDLSSNELRLANVVSIETAFSEANSYCMTPNFLAFAADSKLFIWNFVDGQCVQWVDEKPDDLYQPIEVCSHFSIY